MCNETTADCFIAVEKDRRENPFFPVDREGKVDEICKALEDVVCSIYNGEDNAAFKGRVHLVAAKVIRCLEGF